MSHETYKILAIHNYFKHEGGEDKVFDTETNLLESAGHHVIRYTLHNDQINEGSQLKLALTTIWNVQTQKDLHELVRRTQPQIAHFHNSFPLISPSAYWTLKSEQIPIVQTLHDYRFFCINGLFFRDNLVCERCIGKFVQWPGIQYRCYRGDRAASGVATLINLVHRLANTWSKTVDIFIALTELSKRKYIQAGMAPKKIIVKPNCVYPEPLRGNGSGNNALFIGRLSPEKGIGLLMSAWKHPLIQDRQLVLRIAGQGPLEDFVQTEAANTPGIQYLGQISSDKVIQEMQRAAFLIVPSIWYEGFPRVIAEAFATGLPVVGSRIGNLAEVIKEHRTGVLFDPTYDSDLAHKICWMLDHPTALLEMRSQCHQEFARFYSPDNTLRQLTDIYKHVIEQRS